MSVIRVGSTGKYAEGWDAIFGAGKTARGKVKASGGKRKAGRTAAAKTKAKTVTKPKAGKGAAKSRKKTAARKKR